MADLAYETLTIWGVAATLLLPIILFILGET